MVTLATMTNGLCVRTGVSDFPHSLLYITNYNGICIGYWCNLQEVFTSLRESTHFAWGWTSYYDDQYRYVASHLKNGYQIPHRGIDATRLDLCSQYVHKYELNYFLYFLSFTGPPVTFSLWVAPIQIAIGIGLLINNV